MKYFKNNLPLLAVIIAATLMLLPFLGLADFNTKGEPREAVVALSMLKEGNWILPVNNGMDIPYKPPFFHYCIALLSLLCGGINEYTSRLPSALALIALTVSCFVFYRRRMSTTVALSGALLLLTSFEVHRAGVNCRVDMVLTAFTVGAMLLFYRWWERGSRGVPVWAVLCMSCAVLTKGPVGFIVPCFVMGVFSLLRGEKFWRTFLSYSAFALLSCVLPTVWYVAAWLQGGDHFLDLVYEENIGRMTGTMNYESHTHPFTYNFFTLFTGWAPWALLFVASLFTKPWKGLICKTTGEPATGNEESKDEAKSSMQKLMAWLMRQRLRIMMIPPVKLFTWLAFLLVLFFYSLPSSKRSVYLLPCYPFMAILIAEYIEWLWQTKRRGALRAYTIIMVVLLAALPVMCGVMAVRDLMVKRSHEWRGTMYYNLFVPVVVIFVALDGLYQPLVLNTKSLRPMAEYMATTFRGEKLYQYVNDPMMHFFGADYYLDDELAQFETPVRSVVEGKTVVEKKTPTTGVLVVPEGDFESLAKRYPQYSFTLLRTMPRGAAELRDNICFYRFEVQ